MAKTRGDVSKILENLMTEIDFLMSGLVLGLRLFPLIAKPTFIQSLYLKALAASLGVGFCDEWKRGLRYRERFRIVIY